MPALNDNYGVLVTGIGGTGVLTVSAILGMAAHLEGKGCSIMDMTGMAQKNGAVLSHLRLAPTRGEIYSTRIGAASAAVVIGCDMVVSAGMEAMKAVRPGYTHSVINSTIVPTAQFQANKNVDFQEASLLNNIKKVNGAENVSTVDATRIATALLGDSIATNLFMVGYAVQKGLVPLSIETIEQAIRLNGVAVTMNMHAFNWGRVAANDPVLVEQVADQMKARPAADMEHKVETLDDVIAIRRKLLTDYQNVAYANKYSELVEWVKKREQELMPGSERLTAAVAHNYAKVMAYKDEYEVARLYTSGPFMQKLQETFEGDFEVKFNLAPPLFSKRDPRTGELLKKEYPSWMMSAFNVLARFKGLRGTALDIFGKTEERRMERRLIGEYEALVRHVIAKFSPEKVDQAAELLSLYDDIRGYGHIKDRNHKEVKQKEAALLARYEGKLAATVVQFAPDLAKTRKAS
jgi:indolepyruvate ferredoxin oxidoreductase